MQSFQKEAMWLFSFTVILHYGLIMFYLILKDNSRIKWNKYSDLVSTNNLLIKSYKLEVEVPYCDNSVSTYPFEQFYTVWHMPGLCNVVYK